MKIIATEVGGGKTTALVDIMLEPGNEDVVYVAPTFSQSDHAHRVAKQRAADAGRPTPSRTRFIRADQILARATTGDRFVLDEVDGILHFLLGGAPVAIAGTDEDVKAAQIARIRGERA